MKKIIYKTFLFLSFSLLITFFNSCEEAVDIPLLSELESNFYSDENRVNRGIGAIYAEVANLYGTNFNNNGPIMVPRLLMGDDLTISNNTNLHYEAFASLQSGDTRILRNWQYLYITISRANLMIEKLQDPTVLKVFTTPGLSDWCMGEALFLRSWANAKLWDYFRKAPNQNMRLKAPTEASLPLSKDFELLDQAINDLKKAEELLPDSWKSSFKGRVFKNSARGLLVKLYNMRACYADKYPGGNKQADYASAISYFEKIDPAVSSINGVKFAENFDYRTENNKESLYEYQASFNLKEDNPWLYNNQGSDAASVGVCLVQYGQTWARDSYIGGAIGPTPKLIIAFDADDPRKAETFILTYKTSSDPVNPFKIGLKWNLFDGYQFVKYVNGDRMGPLDTKYGLTSLNNIRILRLADVKLAAAEAYFQTGNELKAREQVNDVRKRARESVTPAALQPADYTSAITMNDIIKERFLELAGEDDIRWADLRRWHSAGYINLANWTAADFGYDESKHNTTFSFQVGTHLLWPIPLSEIQNNGQLTADQQNPGY